MLSATKHTHMPNRKQLFYGDPGIGKSTLASLYPNPVFVTTEDGVRDIPGAISYEVAHTLEELKANLREIYTADHDRETVIIDSLDWAEPLVWNSLMEGTKYSSIEEFGFGKGYIMALKVWSEIRMALDHLHAKGMHIVLICHAHQKKVSPPEGETYDQVQPMLHDKAWRMWVQWSTETLAMIHQPVTRAGKDERVRAKGSRRVIITSPDEGFAVAKNRLGLPARIALDQDNLQTIVHQLTNSPTH